MRPTRMKRSIDFLGAAVILLLSFPLILGVALLVRAFLGRPVLFRQTRAGRFGKPFTLVKFRTMRDATGPDGRPLPDEQRLTRLGRFLRRTSLDELPQLVNVLRGEMSLVGPRPLIAQYVDRYTPEQARRLEMKPGLTGWAQVNGRNGLSWEDKFALDVWYVEHWSLRLDVNILWKTILMVPRCEGICHGGETTMPEFMGSSSGRNDSRPQPSYRRWSPGPV